MCVGFYKLEFLFQSSLAGYTGSVSPEEEDRHRFNPRRLCDGAPRCWFCFSLVFWKEVRMVRFNPRRHENDGVQ